MNVELPELLERRLAEPLACPALDSRFVPRPRWGRTYYEVPPQARQAAVLLLLYPQAEQWHLPLTLRPTYLPDHAGQISLPGGAVEPGESGRQAALREFHEELGAAGHPIRLVGRLSTLYVPASNFAIEPWVGFSPQRPPLEPNPQEVAALLEVPLPYLLDPANLGCSPRQYQGQPYTAPHFLWQSHQIWGATCMILGELVLLLESMGVRG